MLGVIRHVDPSTFGDAFVKATMLQVLHEHPDWLLADLGKYFDDGGPLAKELGAITVAEVMALHERPPPDLHRLERAHAQTLQGPDFDALVHEVIHGAGKWVQANYVRERAGGPRWKLQAAFRRLTKAGLIDRKGRSSNVHYRSRKAPAGSASA